MSLVNEHLPIGKVLEQTGDIPVIDLAVPVYIQISFVCLHFPTGQILEQPGGIPVVQLAVVVDISGRPDGRQLAGGAAVLGIGAMLVLKEPDAANRTVIPVDIFIIFHGRIGMHRLPTQATGLTEAVQAVMPDATVTVERDCYYVTPTPKPGDARKIGRQICKSGLSQYCIQISKLFCSVEIMEVKNEASDIPE